MKRMGMVIGIRPERIAEYKKTHAAVWPEILAKISDCNIRNYTIFLREPENSAVRLLGVSRRRLGDRRGEDGGRPEDAGMVGDPQADAGAARDARQRRLVGDGGRSVPSRLRGREP